MGKPLPRGSFEPQAQPPSLPQALVAHPLSPPSPDPLPDTLATARDGDTLAPLAALLDAHTLAEGAGRLAATLAARGSFDRVSVGLLQQGRMRVVATAPGTLTQLPPELLPLIQGAMDEAVEQGLALAAPLPVGDHGDALVLEQLLLQRALGGAVATLPLGRQGRAVGALCIERRHTAAGPTFTPAEVRQLQIQAQLAAPALDWLRAATEPWHRRAMQDLRRHAAALRQPNRRTLRRLLVAGAAALGFLALVPLQDAVSGRARIEGGEQRVMAAPTDGFIKTAHVRPGDRVAAGAPLVDLLEADLKLERERWGSQLAQHENAYAAAMARADRVTAATSLARVSEAQSQLALVDEQLTRGRLVAPFDALVIQGDLSQSVGAPVRQGDALMTLATVSHQRVIVEIDEVDIGRVATGQSGLLALSSLPWGRDELVVERIAPMARAVDGRNVFEVQARLPAPQAALRPGLLGRADIVTGRAPLLWSWTHQALLRMRVALWAWLA